MNSIYLTAASGGSWGIMIIYLVFMIGFMFLVTYLPQRREKKKHDEMMATLTPGDSVLTTSGMYGVVVDITEDMVIVEFGGNKNCRIPMQKAVIVSIEKEAK